MFASVTSFQPQLQGLQNPRQSVVNEEAPSNDTLKKENSASLASDASKLAKKAFADLSQKQQIQVQKLKSRDIEVKAHEQAHLSAAGALAIGGASFTYTTGPNGMRYATGGEVNIDTSAVANDPAATIRKAETIRRAALAPANPSSQDQLVASQAGSLQQKAKVELIQEIREQQNKETLDKEEQDEEKIEATDQPEQTKEKDTTSKNKFIATESNLILPGTLLDIAI
jgi:hypothetical protein